MSDFWDLIVPKNATDFWTSVIAIGTWVLVVGALVSFSQLRLTKKDMEDRRSRRMKETAIEATRTFIADIIPKCDPLTAPCRALGLTPSDLWKTVRLGENETEHFDSAVALLSRLHHKFRVQTVETLNALEAWSMIVTSGLADEEVAFLGNGTTYCAIVRELLPMILYVRGTRQRDAVSAVAKLYDIWSKRVSDLGADESDRPFWEKLPRTPG